MVLAAIITLTGCSDCKTSPGNTQISPEITGEADDGLYLYSGNMRYTSDYENGEELITSVDIDGVTYNDIEFFDALYIGDNAYMSINYYENDASISPLGNCIIKYNVADKTQELIYHYTYDVNDSFGERMFISDILSVSGDGTKMAALSQYSNLTLFIYNGAVVDELHNSFDACTYCDDFAILKIPPSTGRMLRPRYGATT